MGLFRGATVVAKQARMYSARAQFAKIAFGEGRFGIAVVPDGQLVGFLKFAILDGRVVEIDLAADPERLQSLELVYLDQ